MGVRGVLIDLDGPLLVDGTEKPRPGVPQFLKELKERGLVIGAMTNQPAGESNLRLLESELPVDSLHSAELTGTKKPGGSLVADFCADHGLEPHQTLVIGDDRWGVLEGLNGRALAFHGTWGFGTSEYGIEVSTPQEFIEYLDVFFRKTALWYARYTGSDQIGRQVLFRALIDARGAGSDNLRSLVLQTLKDREEAEVSGASMSAFLMMHMIASAYLEGLLSVDRKEALWQIYPGHAPESAPPPLIQAVIEGFTLFRSRAAEKELYGLKRWQNALQSHVARQGPERNNVKFQNQVSSVSLAEGTKVKGKRVLVIDDFCTEGYSLEAARNIYYAAGAEAVFLFAFGKYGEQQGNRYTVFSPKNDTTVHPFEHVAYTDTQFESDTRNTQINPDALKEFIESVKRLHGTSIAKKLLI